jgi:hypothetical protein
VRGLRVTVLTREVAGLISEVVAGVLIEVIAETGRRIGTAMVGRRHKKDLEVARWFDTCTWACPVG